MQLVLRLPRQLPSPNNICSRSVPFLIFVKLILLKTLSTCSHSNIQHFEILRDFSAYNIVTKLDHMEGPTLFLALLITKILFSVYTDLRTKTPPTIERARHMCYAGITYEPLPNHRVIHSEASCHTGHLLVRTATMGGNKSPVHRRCAGQSHERQTENQATYSKTASRLAPDPH